MKRTTYIIIGMYLGGLLLILIGVVTFWAFFVGDRNIITIELPEETTQADLAGIETVEFHQLVPHTYSSQYDSPIRVVQAQQGTAGQLVYPASEHMKVERNGNKLSLTMDFETAYNTANDAGYRIEIPHIAINLEISDTPLTIVNRTSNVMKVHGVTVDSLYLYSLNQISINNSNIRALRLDGNTSFVAENTSVRDMYANVDNIREWTYTSTTVQNQYLSGNRRTSSIPYTGNSGRIFWKPLSEEARMLLIVDDPVEINMNPITE